ncbi:hypothetical protein HGM15179_012524 [Zosterops borbonicus]|uniref:Uncharacterized protein n=1 Tax=Zosterops borbonicus TaxID=364589 RepID=A0A8K1G9Q0_9PASS|nr:hypothetical protein HGM15179_012524 [Zosterops borbonicus]
MQEEKANLVTLEPGDAGNYEERPQGEARIEQELSPAETSSYNKGSQGEVCVGQELSPEAADICHLISLWFVFLEEELSHGDVESYEKVSEECPEKSLSQGRVGTSHSLSDWEDYSQQELSHGYVSTYREVLDWKQSVGQERPQEEDPIAQKVSKGDGKKPSMQSSWESDSEQDLMQYGWEQSIGDKALLHKEDGWDKIRILKLCKDQERERRLAGLAGGGFLMAVPHEGWVEDGASELRPWGLLCASPPHVEALAPRGHGAPGAFQEQEPEAGTLSQQRAPRKKRLSRLRRALRALRGLFHFSCCAPWPQD